MLKLTQEEWESLLNLSITEERVNLLNRIACINVRNKLHGKWLSNVKYFISIGEFDTFMQVVNGSTRLAFSDIHYYMTIVEIVHKLVNSLDLGESFFNTYRCSRKIINLLLDWKANKRGSINKTMSPRQIKNKIQWLTYSNVPESQIDFFLVNVSFKKRYVKEVESLSDSDYMKLSAYCSHPNLSQEALVAYLHLKRFNLPTEATERLSKMQVGGIDWKLIEYASTRLDNYQLLDILNNVNNTIPTYSTIIYKVFNKSIMRVCPVYNACVEMELNSDDYTSLIIGMDDKRIATLIIAITSFTKSFVTYTSLNLSTDTLYSVLKETLTERRISLKDLDELDYYWAHCRDARSYYASFYNT